MSAQPSPKATNIVALTPAYVLTPKQKQTAKMIAEGRNNEEITNTVRISLRTLYKWKKLSLFVAETARHNKALAEVAAKQFVAEKDSLGPLAVAILKQALLAGDKRIALEIAKATGQLSPNPINENEGFDVELKQMTEQEYKRLIGEIR
jgi:DNA-binding CsgD family transcriptional regulator